MQRDHDRIAKRWRSGGDGRRHPTSSDGSTTAPNKVPATSTTEAKVVVGAVCPAFTACGGTLDGTYDYAGGCLGDLLADAKKRCPALDASGAKVVVTGSLHFLGGNALTRDVTSAISGTLRFPAACVAGQCATVEAALKSSRFPTASCSGAAACDCTISRTDTTKSATTYTVSEEKVTTGDGETYAICSKGSELSYSGKSAGSEDGTWTLKKR